MSKGWIVRTGKTGLALINEELTSRQFGQSEKEFLYSFHIYKFKTTSKDYVTGHPLILPEDLI